MADFTYDDIARIDLPAGHPLVAALQAPRYCVHKADIWAVVGRSGPNWLDPNDPDNADAAIRARALAHAEKIGAEKVTVGGPEGEVIWP